VQILNFSSLHTITYLLYDSHWENVESTLALIYTTVQIIYNNKFVCSEPITIKWNQNFINEIFVFENQSTIFEKWVVILILVCFIGYRQDGSTECTRTITDLASACQTLAALNAKSYFEGFRVAKVIKICSYCSLHFHDMTWHDMTLPPTSEYPLLKCLVILPTMAIIGDTDKIQAFVVLLQCICTCDVCSACLVHVHANPFVLLHLLLVNLSLC